MDIGYFSHMPLLVAATVVTTGPVLELGAGLGSTLALHGICGVQGRDLTTIESDESWICKFVQYGRPWHKFKLVNDFKNIPEYEMQWGLAFIDHGIPEQRSLSAMALRDVPIVILHDTCHARLYGYEEVIPKFKYSWNYRIMLPQTTVVSNSIDVGSLFARMAL
jgi:hypothetical protein